MIHVCSLARLHQTVEETGALHVITLMKNVSSVVRPASVPRRNHLLLDMDDIVAPFAGYVAPSEEHVTRLIDFVAKWDRAKPLVVHCFAGISRSSAGAFIAACALNPYRSEREIARALRSASPIAHPNIRLVTLADTLLRREGKMIGAIEEIGAGQPAHENTPFRLDFE